MTLAAKDGDAAARIQIHALLLMLTGCRGDCNSPLVRGACEKEKKMDAFNLEGTTAIRADVPDAALLADHAARLRAYAGRRYTYLCRSPSRAPAAQLSLSPLALRDLSEMVLVLIREIKVPTYLPSLAVERTSTARIILLDPALGDAETMVRLINNLDDAERTWKLSLERSKGLFDKVKGYVLRRICPQIQLLGRFFANNGPKQDYSVLRTAAGQEQVIAHVEYDSYLGTHEVNQKSFVYCGLQNHNKPARFRLGLDPMPSVFDMAQHGHLVFGVRTAKPLYRFAGTDKKIIPAVTTGSNYSHYDSMRAILEPCVYAPT